MKTFLRELLITAVLALAIFFAAQATIKTYVVIMSSMEPSFYEGDRVVVNKAVYWFGDPDYGDVVVFKAPTSFHDDYIKRIIGLPGDRVEVKNGAVYVNGVKLDEPYIVSPPDYTMPEKVVPEGSYFVLGDNRPTSYDSGDGWLLPRENIHGKAWLITWPPKDWEVVPDYELDEQLAEAGA